MPAQHPFRLALPALLVLACATAPAARAPAPAAAPSPAPAPSSAPPLPAQGGTPLPPPPREPPVRVIAQATVGAVGDVMIQEAVKRSAAAHGRGAPDEGFSWLFAPIADLLAAPDLTFANLETPVAPDAARGTREFVFNAPPAAAEALRRAGVDAVSFTNNHVFDQGRAGFEETLRRVEAIGLRVLGAGPAGRAHGPVHVDLNGIRFAFLAYAYGFNAAGGPCARGRACVEPSLLDRARAVEDVRAAAAGADAVVVSLHWGVEYEPQPRSEDVALARRLADAGALAVIGHHPHVLQPVELYPRADGRTAVIAYSLGNFVSNQSRRYVFGVTPETVAAPREGAFLRLTFARRDYGRGVTRVEVSGADVLPLWTENDTAEIDARREPQRRPAIRVVAIDRALAQVRAELARFADPVPDGDAPRWARLRKQEALLLARRASVAATVGEELVRTLAPSELGPPGAGSPPAPPAPAPSPAATPSATR
jgi:poly-gamma-glutamate synthesis protein (capsule biosynthesis protein)